MATEGLIAGVDIGGTNTRIAISATDQPEKILIREAFSTPVGDGPEHMVRLLSEQITLALSKPGLPSNSLKAVGCTLPGVTDAERGIALFISNLVGWDGFPMGEALSKALGVPAVVENDVNAAAYGEFRSGGMNECHSLVYFTVSTGIAAGIVIEGRLLRGFNYGAGELGFFVPEPKFLEKDWRPSGCLELKSAGIGLAKMWAHAQGVDETDVSALDVFEAAESGDSFAVEIVSNAADYIAQAAISICNIINPEELVLGGSIAEHQTIIIERLQDVLSVTLPYCPVIRLTNFGGDAPLVGALALAFDNAI